MKADLIFRPGSRLIFKRLLTMTLWAYPEREIVYRDVARYTYREFYNRIRSLANALESLGVKEHVKVGVLDYNTHRYPDKYIHVYTDFTVDIPFKF